MALNSGMKSILYTILFSALLLLITNQTFSQSDTTKTKKTTTKKQEVPPPPPPRQLPPKVEAKKITPPKIVKDDEVKKEDIPPEVQELQDTKIDMLSVDTAVNYNQEPFLDTIPPPQDDLTKELKIMLEMTGALNLGVQFAKGLQDLQATGQDILPKEFYERLYEAIANGDGRRWFENAIIKIYRKHLTLEDVKQLTAFYSTPAGKKYISLLPVFLEESKEAGTGIGRYLGLKIYEQLLEEGKLK
jgi:hypothetical protein